MPAKVVDASVLAALIFRESRFSEAASLLADASFYEPTLLPYELANITRKKAIEYPAQTPAFMEAFREFLSHEIEWRAVDSVAVVGLALETRLTTYDASYLYLSRTLGIPLITFDERLAKAAQG